MVTRILRFLEGEVRGLHEAAYLLASFAFLSHVLGLVRDRLIAGHFGAGAELDVYYAAFRIPDFIFISVASLVSAAVLVPLLGQALERNKAEARELISSLFLVFSILLVAACLVAFALMPRLVPIVLPGFHAEGDVHEIILLSRILLLSPILLGLSNFFGGIVQASKRFLALALAPVLYNAGIIVGVLFFLPRWGVRGLTMGVILGALLHLAIQFPMLIVRGLLPTRPHGTDSAAVRRTFLLSVPRTIALSTAHLALLFLYAFASFMDPGSITVFQLAFNLQSVPLSIVGVSYSMAAFPALSRLFTKGDREMFLSEVLSAGRHIIFWSLGISVLFIVLRAQIVRTILGTGEFSWSDTRLTAAAFALFAVSAAAQGLVLLFTRAYYSASSTSRPLYINLFSSLTIILSAHFFRQFFENSSFFQDFLESLLRVEGVGGTSALVLPLAYTIGSLLNAAALWKLFEYDFRARLSDLTRTLMQSGSAALIMGFVAYEALKVFDDVFDISTGPGIFLQGFFAGLVGILAGIIILGALRSRELAEVWMTLHQRIWGVKVIAPEQTEL